MSIRDHASAALPIGRYSIAVSYPTFRPYKRRDIVLDANSALAINAILEPGQQSQTITVYR